MHSLVFRGILIVLLLSLGAGIGFAGENAVGGELEKSVPGTKIWKEKLYQPVAFEFDCEPLRNVLRFIKIATDVDIRVDPNIYNMPFTTSDCDDSVLNRNEIFITAKVSEVPLATALLQILAPHNLVCSVKTDHIYIHAAEKSDPNKTREWAEIKVRNVFDATRQGGFVAIIEISGRRQFVREGQQFLDYTVKRIDGVRLCLTITRQDEEVERTFCVEDKPAPHQPPVKESVPEQPVKLPEPPQERPTEKKTPKSDRPKEWAEIKVMSVFDPKQSGTFIAIIKVNGRSRFVRESDQFIDYTVQRIDGIQNCLTITRQDEAAGREFCKEK